jgi:hypothetical protein
MTEKTVKRVERVSRKPLSRRGPQAIAGEKDPNFEYRFVNDTGSRVAVFNQAGWELVQDDGLVVGDNRVLDSELGSGKRVISNDGTVQYLMRIKKEWYQEDQLAKQKELLETETAMKKDSQADYGKLALSRDE